MATLSRRERTDATRQVTEAALLAAAVELLGEGTPFAEIGIEQIVRRAGFSRPTFYTYFRDKRELILRLGQTLQDAIAEAADPWLTSAHGQTRETLKKVLDAFRVHRAALAAITEAATYDPQVQAFWRALNGRFAAIATERVAAGVPSIDREHAASRAHALVWMTERVLTEHLANPLLDEDALLDELTLFWQNATREGPAQNNR
jgi:AcrR family transcriptional regulator